MEEGNDKIARIRLNSKPGVVKGMEVGILETDSAERIPLDISHPFEYHIYD